MANGSVSLVTDGEHKPHRPQWHPESEVVRQHACDYRIVELQWILHPLQYLFHEHAGTAVEVSTDEIRQNHRVCRVGPVVLPEDMQSMRIANHTNQCYYHGCYCEWELSNPFVGLGWVQESQHFSVENSVWFRYNETMQTTFANMMKAEKCIIDWIILVCFSWPYEWQRVHV